MPQSPERLYTKGEAWELLAITQSEALDCLITSNNNSPRLYIAYWNDIQYRRKQVRYCPCDCGNCPDFR
jgi:hypothetical protein